MSEIKTEGNISELPTALVSAIVLMLFPNGMPNCHYGFSNESENERAKQNHRNQFAFEVDKVLRQQNHSLFEELRSTRKCLLAREQTLIKSGEDWVRAKEETDVVKLKLETLESENAKLRAETSELKQQLIKEHLPEEFESWEKVWNYRVKICEENKSLHEKLQTALALLGESEIYLAHIPYCKADLRHRGCNCGKNGFMLKRTAFLTSNAPNNPRKD